MNPSQQPSSPPCDARVACVDSGESPTTNKADSAELPKMDDPGRGGFLKAGSYASDRSGRKRGPLEITNTCGDTWLVDDEFGVMTFDNEGRFIGDMDSCCDLIAPWIDWKAECERLAKVLGSIAEQKLVEEMVDHTAEHGDYEGAYEIIVKMSRAALASLNREGAGE